MPFDLSKEHLERLGLRHSNSDWIVIGARLRDAREFFGLSQDEVAEKLRVPRQSISRIESGQRRVDVLEIRQFATLYESSVAYLSGERDSFMPVDVVQLARHAAKLTTADRAELRRYAQTLKSKTSDSS